MKIRKIFESKFENIQITGKEWKDATRFGNLVDVSDSDIMTIKDYFSKFVFKRVVKVEYLARIGYSSGSNYIPVSQSDEENIFTFHSPTKGNDYYGILANDIPYFRIINISGGVSIIKDSDEWFYIFTESTYPHKCDTIDGLIEFFDKILTKNWKKKDDDGSRKEVISAINTLSDDKVLTLIEFMRSQNFIK